jgi:hypothetical protein
MFNQTVSMLDNFASTPEDIRIFEWLDYVKKGCDYTELVFDYRENPCKDKKKRMPSVILGARCEGGHKMEHIVEYSGWVSIDIDDDHNPEISNWTRVRDELGKLSDVGFSALSLSGNGVWLLMKVAYPDRQSSHFNAIQGDFERLGIRLDTSKGKKPNDKRFISYDPYAIKKTDVEIYTKLKGEKPLQPVPSNLRTHYTGGSDVFNRGIKFAYNQGYTFTHGEDLHYSIFNLCVFLNFKGIPRSEAEAYINREIISLNEIRSNCIEDAYRRFQYNFGADATINQTKQYR